MRDEGHEKHLAQGLAVVNTAKMLIITIIITTPLLLVY